MSESAYLRSTQRWVNEFVIGFNLCPFAAKPQRQSRIRYLLEETRERSALAKRLLAEAFDLRQQSRALVETLLLVHPRVLLDFEEYLDFVAKAEATFEAAGLTGDIQIATFHPDYRFQGTHPDDPENFTNRSPYPMLHLLREESVSEAVESYPDTERIPEKNRMKMRTIGREVLDQTLEVLQSEEKAE